MQSVSDRVVNGALERFVF